MHPQGRLEDEVRGFHKHDIGEYVQQSRQAHRKAHGNSTAVLGMYHCSLRATCMCGFELASVFVCVHACVLMC